MPRGKRPFNGFGRVEILAGQTALASPPVFFGDVGNSWNLGNSVPAEFDIEIKANGTLALTGLEIVGVVQDQIQIASDDVDTVDFANNELDVATHGLSTGYGPIQFTTTDTLPTGISLLTDYYVIEVNAGTIQIATSLENALEGTAVAFSDAGTGTHSFEGSAVGDPDGDGYSFLTGSNNSFEAVSLSYGLLGPASDGAVDLTADLGYSTRIYHRPRTVLYTLAGTHPGTVEITASLYPVQDVT